MNWLLLSILLSALAFTGCASVGTRVYKDPNAYLDAHLSFNWAHEIAPLVYDPASNDRFVGGHLQLAAERELARKGYEKSPHPDLLFGYHVALTQELSPDTMHDRYRFTSTTGYLLWRGGDDWSAEPVDMEQDMARFELGTVVLDVFDAHTRRLLWRGSTPTRVHQSLSRSERDVILQNAARTLLSAYPAQ